MKRSTITIIILIFIAVGGFYLFSSNGKSIKEPKETKQTTTTKNSAVNDLGPKFDIPSDWKKFESKHGFSMHYPPNWRLSSPTIENYDNLEKADSIGANHFAIVSWKEGEGVPKGGISKDKAKLEGWVFNEDHQNLKSFIESRNGYENIQSSRKIRIGDNKGIVIFKGKTQRMSPLNFSEVFFYKNSLGIEMDLYHPSESAQKEIVDLEKIAQTFRLEEGN